MVKLLYLTSVLLVPNSEGEEKIEKVIKRRKGGGEPMDDNDKSADWYRDMNIKVPKHLLDEENDEDSIDEDGNILLQEHEMEYEFVDSVIVLSEFQSCVENQRIGAIVYLKDSSELHVEESVMEIWEQIDYLQRPNHIKARDYFRGKYYQIKYRIKKKLGLLPKPQIAEIKE